MSSVTSGRNWANRTFSGENNRVVLEYKTTLDASGDPTASATTHTRGITSLARGTTGSYVVTLAEAYNKLLGLEIFFEKTTDPNIRWYLHSETVASTRLLNLRFAAFGSPTVAANPVSCKIYIKIIVKQGAA